MYTRPGEGMAEGAFDADKFAETEETNVTEGRRVAEMREKVVKEHKEKANKLKFHFDLFQLCAFTMCAFIVVDLLGLDFWDREPREKRA